MTYFFSQKNTEEQNTQYSTETLSQPISQNLTAIFGSNALWTLYAGGLLWARNVRQKPPWTLCALWEKKMSFVRERTPHDNSPMFFFSQIYTEEQNTQRPTETLSQPISQNLTATEASPPCLTPFKNMSFPIQEHALLHSRTCPSTSKNTPFLMLDKALL